MDAFKFYKNQGSSNVRRFMESGDHENKNTPKHVQHLKNFFAGPNVRRGNLTSPVYRGMRFVPTNDVLNNKSFQSWTTNLNTAIRFSKAGPRETTPGSVLVMNGNKVPAYFRYATGHEQEILLPPGTMNLGKKSHVSKTIRSMGRETNVPYTQIQVSSFR